MQKEAITNKLNFILAQEQKDETVNDTLYKYQLKILFKAGENNSFTYLFDERSHISKIIFKIIDILYMLFKMKKNEREKIYNSDVRSLENEELNKLVIELNILQNYDLDINNNLVDLFNIINEFIESKKKNASLCDFIDSILLSVSFNTGYDCLLKYQMFSMIIQYFLQKYEIVVPYFESDINVTEDKSISLIVDLFTKDEINFAVVVQSIIILNYNSLSDVIGNCTDKEIFLGIDNIAKRLNDIKHVGKISVCVEKIVEMFVDDITSQKNQKKIGKKKNKKSKKKKKPEKNVEIKPVSKITTTINEGNNDIIMTKNTTEPNEPSVSFNKINNEIKDKCEENDLNNPKLNIINLFNNIVNKIKMGNEVLNQDIDNLKNLIMNIVDNNDKLAKNVEKLNEEMVKKNQEIQKLSQEYQMQKQNIGHLVEENEKQNQNIGDLEERIEALEKDCDDMKYIISRIQFRDLSKNFLKCFNPYLLDDDFKKIKDNKQLRGEIISNRLKKLFPNADKKKMKVVQDLIKCSSDLINEGNYLAHSITIEEYEDEIENYKNEKNIEQIKSPVIFCFVYFLGISQKFDESFDNSYLFLRQNFNRNLKSLKSKNLLENYFNY